MTRSAGCQQAASASRHARLDVGRCGGEDHSQLISERPGGKAAGRRPTPELARALDCVFAVPGFPEGTVKPPWALRVGAGGWWLGSGTRLFPRRSGRRAAGDEATVQYIFEHSMILALVQDPVTHPDVAEDVGASG